MDLDRLLCNSYNWDTYPLAPLQNPPPTPVMSPIISWRWQMFVRYSEMACISLVETELRISCMSNIFITFEKTGIYTYKMNISAEFAFH